MTRYEQPGCDPLAESTDPSVRRYWMPRVVPTAAVALRARLVAEMVAEGCSEAEAAAQVAHLEEMTR